MLPAFAADESQRRRHQPMPYDAEYQREWRRKRGVNVGHPGRPVTKPHGTVAAYRRHQRAGETPCEVCKQANALYHRELYKRRKT
jgi:hypothetical protein